MMEDRQSRFEIYHPSVDYLTGVVFLLAFVYFIMTGNAFPVLFAVLLSFIHSISVIDKSDKSLSLMLCFGFGKYWPWTVIKLAGKWIRIPFLKRVTMLNSSLQLNIERSEVTGFEPYSDKWNTTVDNALYLIQGERRFFITSGDRSSLVNDANKIIDFLGLGSNVLNYVYKYPKPTKHLFANPRLRRLLNILIFLLIGFLCVLMAAVFIFS